jgi:Ser/Thr protein kinase RdoA (MazF antagonist)
MKTEPRDIDRIELSRFLGVEYGLEAGTLTFLPKGEDSSGYVFEGDAHSKYFVRVQPARGSAALENALRVARSVRERCVLREVVAALRTRDGSVTCLYGKYRVAAFPFIEGPTAWEAHLSEPGLAYAAQVLGRLHACDSSGWPKLPIEKFQVLFRPAILGRLKDAPGSMGRSIDASSSRARGLLQAEWVQLLETFERIGQLGRRLRRLSGDSVVTHGDPNLDNWIQSPEGSLHLIDWGDLALGPPERDLFAFSGEHFAPFLKTYASVQGKCRLNLDVFEFYFYRWVLQEVSDFGSRLLVDDLDELETDHAWNQLQNYLPIRHASIGEDLSALRRDAVLILGSENVR